MADTTPGLDPQNTDAADMSPEEKAVKAFADNNELVVDAEAPAHLIFDAGDNDGEDEIVHTDEEDDS